MATHAYRIESLNERHTVISCYRNDGIISVKPVTRSTDDIAEVQRWIVNIKRTMQGLTPEQKHTLNLR